MGSGRREALLRRRPAAPPPPQAFRSERIQCPGHGGAPQETGRGGPPPGSCLKGRLAWGLVCRLCLRTTMPRPLPLLLLPLLLCGPPAVQPAPPTCYSRMLGLSREITGDFRSLQATEPAVSARRPSSRRRAFAAGRTGSAPGPWSPQGQLFEARPVRLGSNGSFALSV